MSVTFLGKLEPVDPRQVWPHEAGDFTPWLAQPENLAILGDIIQLDLELAATEQFVGPYRADIVCKDTVTGDLVLIENQLEYTDHNHLGQILTYAAGLSAATIIWIARRFTDEHRAALDWLNNVTMPGINFFGLEIELWRIGDSPPAPKFNIVCKPNDWVKEIAKTRQESAGDLTERRQMQLEYWTQFSAYIAEHSTLIKPRKALPQYWMDFAIGRSGFALVTYISVEERYIAVGLNIYGLDSATRLRALYESKDAIEREIGSPLRWNELTDKKSRISLARHDTDPSDRDQWPEQHRWLLETLEAFHRAFARRIKNLDVSVYTAGDPFPPDGSQPAGEANE